MRSSRLVLALVALAMFCAWSAAGARAATTLTVTSTADDNGGQACVNGQCPTLRDAVTQANNDSGDTIVLPALSPQPYSLTDGELRLGSDMTIQGAGANQVTIDASNNNLSDRAFEIETPNATISGVTITGGGGAMLVDTGSAGLGGAIYIDSGDGLTLSNSTVSNSQANDGGGIYVDNGQSGPGTLNLQGSTVTGNAAVVLDPGNGGGINVQGNATIVNSTITGNSVTGNGGGIYAESNASLTLTNVTVASNTSQFDGANFYSDDASAGGIQNTIFADPQSGTGNTVLNCDNGADFPPSNGNNLSSDSSACWNNGLSSDQTSVDPKLGPLADNGGPTQTMALLAGSPAIDAAATVASVTTDQRGISRPQGAAYDIGAFEVVQNADLAITKTGSPNPATVGQKVTYTVKVTNNGPAAASGVTMTDTLPSSVTFGSASASQGSCSNSAGKVTCSLGSLAVGGSATVTITVTPNTVGTVTNTATVSSSAPDPNTANNSASATTQVLAAAGAAGSMPLAITDKATLVGFTFATIHGRVDPNGASTIEYFQYGKTKAYGSVTAVAVAGSGTTFAAYSHKLTGLSPGTLYHYRIVAQNTHGTADGVDRTFRTPARPSIHVAPNRVLAGALVRVFGNAGGCPVGDQMTLLSHAFSPAREFAGVPAIYTKVRAGGSYSTTTRIPSSRAAARYLVTARCGGGNLGVSAALTVYRPVLPKFTG